MAEFRIAVGVDGSDESYSALRWALEEARRQGADTTVRAVHVQPVMYMAGLLGEAITPRVDEEADERGRQMLAAIRQRAVDDGFGDVSMDVEQVIGHVTQVLLRTSKDADMLVVGSRGEGGFVGLVLGSVPQSLAGHCSCPLVIVPLSRARSAGS